MTISVMPVDVPLVADAQGVLRVGHTRISLDIVINCFRAGQSAEEIAEQYPTLDLPDLYAVLAFYLQHPAEVDEYLVAQSADADRVRAEWETRDPPAGMRARLLNRRNV